MAILTLRVDDATKEELESLAAKMRISVSELLRKGVDTIINRAADNEPPSHVANTISPIQRATLALLHRIMTQLEEDTDESAHHQRLAEVLENGYTSEYERVFYGLDPEVPLEQCRFVWDVLDLFRIIRASLKKYTARQRAEFNDSETGFAGFDLNSTEEAPLLGYARYLVANGRWSELKNLFDDKHEGGNSHHTTVPRYRAMTARWHQIQRDKRRSNVYLSPDEYLLNPEELELILDAGRLGKQ